MFIPGEGKNTYVVFKQFTSVTNTAEDGFGDFPVKSWHRLAVVVADTPRKAQNKIEKPFGKVRVGGRFPNAQVIDVKDYDGRYGKLPAYAYD